MAPAAPETNVSAALRFRVRVPLEHFELDVSCATDARSVGLFGASGSGKTTIVETLAGWRDVPHGLVEVDGATWLDTERGVRLDPSRRRVGYVPQDLLLFPHLDVAANVRFGGVRDSAHYERVLDVLEIRALGSRNIATLSGGEQQRVALARALCAQPALLLLDEPLGALDRPLRRRILPYLIRVRAEFDIAMVIVSHDPTEIAASCEHVLVLREGRCIAAGAPNEVLASREGRSAGDDEFENVLRGTVSALGDSTARIDLGGAHLEVGRGTLRVGDHALLAVRAEDVLVATEKPVGLSARNVIAARLVRVETGPDARVLARVGTQSVWVDLTEGAVRELELREGRDVFVVIKTRACRVLAGGS